MDTAGGSGGSDSEWKWLLPLVFGRAFITLIFMTHAASLTTLEREWSMTSTQAGLVQTCFSACFALSLFAGSWLCDHVGAKRIFWWSGWLGALSALAYAFFARSFEEALWLYGFVGFALGGTYIPAIILVARVLPPGRRGKGIGWVLAGMSAGYVGSISLTYGVTATLGYQSAFIFCALGVVLGAVFSHMAVARMPDATPAPAPKVRHAALFRGRGSVLLTLGYMGHCWELFGMWAWAPAFIAVSLGEGFLLGPVGLGITIAVALHLSAFFASFTMGQASDRYGRRIVLVTIAALGTACSLGFGWAGHLSPALLLGFAALYGFAALGDSSVLSTAMSEAVPEAFLGRAMAVRSILGIGVGAAAPLAFGVVLDLSSPGQGWGWGFMLMAAGGLVATICATLLPKSRALSG